MRIPRSWTLLASIGMALMLLTGGALLRVRAAERNAFELVPRLAEIFDIVLENYVDTVDPDTLLGGAYDGLLGGLDANGAYLSAAEVGEWKAVRSGPVAGPGLRVLKSGSIVQIVRVDAGSSAEAAKLSVGDQVRSIGGRPLRDLALPQVWRLLSGAPGTKVTLDVVRLADQFKHEQLELTRGLSPGAGYELSVERGIAVLRFGDLARVDSAALASELSEVATRGVEQLLVDARGMTDLDIRRVLDVAGLFASGPLLTLRDRKGKDLERLELPAGGRASAWPGPVAALTNASTAGVGEALVAVLRQTRKALILGEPTYGLGAEPRLYELSDGRGLLVSHAAWQTAEGTGWHTIGVKPDEAVHGKGKDFAAMAADQLSATLDLLERKAKERSAERRAA